MSQFDDTSDRICSLQEQREYDTSSWQKNLSGDESRLQEVTIVSKVLTVDYYYEMSTPIAAFTDERLLEAFLEGKRKYAAKNEHFTTKILLINKQ